MAINAQVTDLQVLLPDHAPVSQFIVDVNLCAMVNSNGIWGGSYNARTGHFDNHTLVHKAHAKHTKHAAHYVNIGYGFVAFVASCFGFLGPSAARLLMALASLELRQHDAFRARTGLDPLVEESARSQFRALCFRQSSARLGHALAKATVKRLLASPSLPLPFAQCLLEIALARLISFPRPSSPLPSLVPTKLPTTSLVLSFLSCHIPSPLAHHSTFF